jgi:hypothetical protein
LFYFILFYFIFLNLFHVERHSNTPWTMFILLYSPYHHVGDCLTAGQFFNYSYEHMNTLFSRPRNEPYSDSYNPTWSNQSNISWQAQAPKNYVSQFHELYHQGYPQFNDQSYSSQYQPTLRPHHLLNQILMFKLKCSNFYARSIRQ